MTRRVLRPVGVLLVAAVAAAVIVALLGPLTDLIARHDVGAFTGSQRAIHLQAARETVRTQLLTLGAGVFAAGALVYTARNFTLSRQSQVTGRYAQAIGQLGSKKLDVRVGGIYALEGVARDSAIDHPTVMEVLSTFIRENSRHQWPRSTSDTDIMEQRTRPDVQAAITVIGSRSQGADLTGADLSGADLRNADLTGAKLTGANFTQAVFGEFRLSARSDGSIIVRRVTDPKLADTQLSEANFSEAIFPASVPTPNGWVRDPASGKLMRANQGTDNFGL
jgi:Pentapeptide repeats (8 copies)